MASARKRGRLSRSRHLTGCTRGAPFLAARRPTLPFNGYAEEVASLYQGMDLRRYF